MASLLSNDDDEPLESLFIKCEFNLNRILNADQRSDDEIILEIIRKFELCQKKIQIESLFSKNEEIDDVSTSSIKYLSLPIYLAKLHGQVTNLYQRKSHLLVSKQLYEEFLSICKNMRITNKEDLYDEVCIINYNALL